MTTFRFPTRSAQPTGRMFDDRSATPLASVKTLAPAGQWFWAYRSAMNGSMGSAGDDLKVLRSIIHRIVIDVVDDLGRQQWSSQNAFHDDTAALLVGAVRLPDDDVTPLHRRDAIISETVTEALSFGSTGTRAVASVTLGNAARRCVKRRVALGTRLDRGRTGIMTRHPHLPGVGAMPPAVRAARRLLHALIIPQTDWQDMGFSSGTLRRL